MFIKAFVITGQEKCSNLVNSNFDPQAQIGSFSVVQSNTQIEISEVKIPEIFQITVQIHDGKDLSYSEMIQIFEKSEGTIKCLIYHGEEVLQWFLIPESRMQCEMKHPKSLNNHIAEMAARIETLPRPYRTILRLHYIEGQSYSKMAQLLGKPKGTVKSLVNRGKKMLLEG